MNQKNSSNEVEKHLKSFTKQEVPDSIDHQIHAGLEKGKKRHNRWNLFKHTTLSAVAACILFILSVNYIPGVSTLSEKIPGFDKVIDQIKFDDGLKDAVENEYIQVIDKSVEQNGITFTVDHVIVDSSRMVLFYTLETEEANRELAIRGADIRNSKGDELNNSMRIYGGRLPFGNHEISNRLEFSWGSDPDITNEITLSFRIEEKDEKSQDDATLREEPISVTFTIDTSLIQKSETYKLDQSAEISGQTIYFSKLVSFPTREVLHLKFDESNNKRIINFLDLHLENEHGETVSTQKGSTLGNERKIYLTGNYFNKHEELYVVLNKASALDKNKQTVVVDLEEEKIIKSPDGQIELFSVDYDQKSFQEDMALHFKMNKEDVDGKIKDFALTTDFKDASGREYTFRTQSHSEKDYFIYLEDKNYTNPLTFNISQYPNYIEGDIRIRIK